MTYRLSPEQGQGMADPKTHIPNNRETLIQKPAARQPNSPRAFQSSCAKSRESLTQTRLWTEVVVVVVATLLYPSPKYIQLDLVNVGPDQIANCYNQVATKENEIWRRLVLSKWKFYVYIKSIRNLFNVTQ